MIGINILGSTKSSSGLAQAIAKIKSSHYFLTYNKLCIQYKGSYTGAADEAALFVPCLPAFHSLALFFNITF